MLPETVKIVELIRKEGWEIENGQVLCEGGTFPLTHPVAIHLKLYRTSGNPDHKYSHMKAAHDYIWPSTIWHYWTERRFYEHCCDWKFISWAAGASASKSYDAAKLTLLWWFANPKNRAAIIASTTLDSAGARIWGYTTKFLREMRVKFPYQYLNEKPPKILNPPTRGTREPRDTLHGIFAVAAKQGDDDSAIATWIGRHPNEALMLNLDEAPDLNPGISKALANLDASNKPFQLHAIGNSNSWSDLHGALSYPKAGIESIDPMIHNKWETTRDKGICLYFSPYESPAIHEKDEKKRKQLELFLTSRELIEKKEEEFGKHSVEFWRFVMGFWRSSDLDKNIMSELSLRPKKVAEQAEWAGYFPLQIVGGLDPGFSTGGDSCLLQLGVLGQTTDGSIVLDFRGESLLFKIRIEARGGIDAETQIAMQVDEILVKHNCLLNDVAIDANGQGRALGGTIFHYMNDPRRNHAMRPPLKIWSSKGSMGGVTNSFDVIVKNSFELWDIMRQFIEKDQIRGLNGVARSQLTSRMVLRGKKTQRLELEAKGDYKRRMGAINPSLARSPDEADAACICLQSAIMNYGFCLGQRRELPRVTGFEHEKLGGFRSQIAAAQQTHFAGAGRQMPSANFSSGAVDLAQYKRPLG